VQDPQLLSLEFKPWGGNSHTPLAATEKHQQRSLCIISQPQHKFVTEKVSGSLVVKDEWNKSQLSWLYLLPI